MDARTPAPQAIARRRDRQAGPPPLRADADQPEAVGELQGKPARLLVVVDLPGAVHRFAGRRVHRQRQAVPGELRRQILLPGGGELSGDHVRRRFRDRCRLPRSLSAETDRRQGRLHAVAADPLFLRYPQSRPADAGPVAADLAADRGAVQGGRRAQAPLRLQRLSNTTGSAPTTRDATSSRA